MLNFKQEISKKIAEVTDIDYKEIERIYRSSKRKKHGRLSVPMF